MEMLSDICNMQVDEATKRTAAMWSLKETIEGFPVSDFERFDRVQTDKLYLSPANNGAL